MAVLEWGEDQLWLHIRVQPKSAVAKWGEVLDGQWLQLKVNAPPVEGAANQACIRFIAKEFGTAKSNVTIVKGEKARNKTVRIRNPAAEKVKVFAANHGLPCPLPLR